MSNIFIGALAILGTLVIYQLSKKLYQKAPLPITLPILTATIIGVVLLLSLDIPHDVYMIGGQWIEWLLGPAVVALAYPLYKQWQILKSNPIPILIGVTFGATLGVSTALLLVKWTNFDESIIYSIVPKNSTTPVAMEVAESLGGIPSLATIFVMIAGIGGTVIGPTLMRWCKIDHFLGKGVGIGTASHAIGTAKAMESGEKEGAVSTVAMTICAVIISVISPIIVFLLL
jgi:predicted murein hydrolase (TIGR00659 family)